MKRDPDYRMKWIRIWPASWFDSSMRIELSNEERAFWVDLLARAGKSRVPGVICSDPEKTVGYPLSMLTSQLVSWSQAQVVSILEKLEKTGRVSVSRSPLLSGEEGLIVEITNWEKYQSEAQRVQKYRNTARSEARNASLYNGKVYGRTHRSRSRSRSRSRKEVEVETPATASPSQGSQQLPSKGESQNLPHADSFKGTGITPTKHKGVRWLEPLEPRK